MIESLPEEVLIDILSRLPVKSLSRFRCVSKSWLCIISDPHFVNLQLTHAAACFTRYKLLIPTVPLRSVDCFTNSITRIPVRSGPTDRDDFNMILGSCNGLVCLLAVYDGDKCVCVFNPSTRCFRTFSYPSGLEKSNVVFGFGFDSASRDYKLVSCPRVGFDGVKMDVFSLKEGSWKCVRGLRQGYTIYESRGVYFRGAIHWLATRYRESAAPYERRVSYVIVSYNLADESFEEISLPDVGDYDINFRNLGACSDCLYVLYYVDDDDDIDDDYCVDLWVTKDSGANASWSKFINIPPNILESRSINCFWLITPENGGVALLNLEHSYMVLCNGIWSASVETHFARTRLWFESIYLESLVPPAI